MTSNLERIKVIAKQAESLPRIDIPPDGWSPTQEELVRDYRRLAAGYATAVAMLQQAITILADELTVVHDELGMRKRRAKSVGKKTA